MKKRIFNKGLLGIAFFTAVSLLLSACYKKFDPDSYRPALSIGGYTSAKEVAPGNLVGYWAFNGSLVDSVSNRAGTNAGTSFTNGIKGEALQGADKGYVLFTPGAAILNMQSFTISYWVNSPVNTNGIVGLVNLSNTQGFWGNIDMFFENGSTQDAAKFRAHITNGAKDAWVEKDGLPGIFGNWVNLTLTYDAASSTFKFYVNGNLSTSKTVANFGPLQFTNSGPMVFGTVHFQTNPSLTTATSAQPWASYLTGALDEVRIYNVALSDSDVNALVRLEGRGK